jgi:hypothetical protein
VKPETREILQSIQVFQTSSIITHYSLKTSGDPIIKEDKDGLSHVTIDDGILEIYVCDDPGMFEEAWLDEIPQKILKCFQIKHPDANGLFRAALRVPHRHLKPFLIRKGVISGHDLDMEGADVTEEQAERANNDWHITRIRFSPTTGDVQARRPNLSVEEGLSPSPNVSDNLTTLRPAAPLRSTPSSIRSGRSPSPNVSTIGDRTLTPRSAASTPRASRHETASPFTLGNASALGNEIRRLARNVRIEDGAVVAAASNRTQMTTPREQPPTSLQNVDVATNSFNMSAMRSALPDISPSPPPRRISTPGSGSIRGRSPQVRRSARNFEETSVIGFVGEQFVRTLLICHLLSSFPCSNLP